LFKEQKGQKFKSSVFTALRYDGLLTVAHKTDSDGMSILKPLKITDTHVVVNVPHLSSLGLLWDAVLRFLKITEPVNGQILLFLRPPVRGPPTLDVLLLQENIPLPEVKLKDAYYA